MAIQSARTLHATFAAAAILASTGLQAEIVDGIAAIVGHYAITRSEIDSQLRLEAMLNRTEPDVSQAARADALDRLVDRRLILQDLTVTPFLAAQPAEAARVMRDLRAERYLGGRDFPATLAHYGLTEAECRAFVEERIAFERYVSFRFKTGLDLEEAAVEAYYRDVYLPRQRARGEPAEPLESILDAISRLLLERRATRLIEERLKELRSLGGVKILAFEDEGERR